VVAEGSTRGFVLADLNNDGWLDIVEQFLGTDPAEAWVSRCGDAAWMRVELRQDAPNVGAVGAKVRFRTAEGSQVRWVRAGGSALASGGPIEVHAGLGDAETVTVDVVWPDGTLTTHGPMPTRQRVRIER
jgi:hypothetical protein